MSPTRLSDSPPPRPIHIRSVEENIAYFRRCSPESTYNLIQKSVSKPQRPSSCTSSVHSSDEEGDDGVGCREHDTIDFSESTKSIEARLYLSNSVESTVVDTQGPQHHEDYLHLSRMSSGSTETSDTAQGLTWEAHPSETPEYNEVLSQRNSVSTEDSDAAQDAAQDATSSARSSEQYESTHEINSLSINDSDATRQLAGESCPMKTCEWCCRPALNCSNVCRVHKIKEKEEAQRDWEIVGYSRFREEQITKRNAEKAILEKHIGEKNREKKGREMGEEMGLMEDEIRVLETELRRKERQIRKWEAEKERENKTLWTRLPIPSLKTIVRAYHGKIMTYSQRNPAGRIALYSKRCSCKDDGHQSIEPNYF